MMGFEYPIKPLIRRHGPGGYQTYESYCDWVRDEFLFRCVYCLHREKWYGRGSTFHVDHLIPVAEDAGGTLEYANLFYACSSCNTAKTNILGVPDPCSVAFADCVRMGEDGQVAALNKMGESLVKKLRLNSKANVEYRYRWIRILASLQMKEPGLFRECMAFPVDLPDLRSKRVPSNSKPNSPHDCWFVRRERGELPETY